MNSSSAPPATPERPVSVSGAPNIFVEDARNKVLTALTSFSLPYPDTSAEPLAPRPDAAAFTA